MMNIALYFFILSVAFSQSVACTSEQVYAKFTKVTYAWGVEESWEVYSAGTKVYTSPTLANQDERVVEVCLSAATNSQYTLKMMDEYGDGWASGAYIMVEGINGNRILKHMMTELVTEEIPLSLYSPINKNDQWKFTSGSVSGEWTQYSFADSEWSQVTLGGSIAPASGTQYFRKQFAGLAGMAAYEFSLNYRYGIVAYINGVEIYRDNMAEGAVTSTTHATGSYSVVEYHSIIRPGVEVSNTQSVFAVEIHFLNEEPVNVDFNAYLAIYSRNIKDQDTCYAYPYGVTLTSSTGYSVENSMDYDHISHFNVAQGPVTISMSLTGPKLYSNGLRIWSASVPTYSPSVFTFQGTNNPNSDNWVDVLSSNGMIHDMNSYKNIYGYFNVGVYSNYRFAITSSSSTNINVNEVYLLTCAISIPTTIEFDASTYNFYAKYDEISISPIVTEFSNCVINPQPSNGLSFDATTCKLSGIATAASNTQYTITSTIGTQTYTGSFTLQVTDCAGTYVKVLRTYMTSAAYEGFTIVEAATQNVVLEVTANSGQVNYQDWSTIVCLIGTKYVVSVNSVENDYWMTSSFLYINTMLDSADGYETILRIKHDARLGLPTSYSFNAQYLIKSMESWNYKMGEVPANWYSSDVSGWASGTAGTFPASTNQIQLYKKMFNVSSLTDVAGIVISFKYQYGYIIYLNNHEVARKGFTGDLSTTSMSSASLPECKYRQISLPIKTMSDGTSTAIDYITTGTNTIAIGLVASGPAMNTANFDAAVRLMGAESVSRIWDVDINYNNIYGDYNEFMDFHYNYVIYHTLCTTNYYEINFVNDRREWISSAILKLHVDQNSQQPKNVIIKAKNPEDSQWTTIKTVSNLNWSLMGQSNRIWLVNNKAYNQYRFENFETGNPDDCYWKIGMIDLRSDATNMVIPALSYPASTSIFKDIEMAEIYSNSEFYTDYTINPPLPTGINMDPYTGTISGTCHDVHSTVTYTVSAKKFNTGETVTAQMSLVVEICTGGKSLITLVARSDGNPEESSWKLYQGKGTTGTVIQSVESLPMEHALSYGDFCLTNGIYTIELKDTYSGWDCPAGYYLTVDVGEMKFEMGQVNSNTYPASVTTMFSSYLPFQVDYDDWKVFKEGSVAENWKAIDFDDSTWTVTKAASIGTNEAVTTYIRREVTLDDVNNYQVLNIRVRYAGGVVAYFNGHKVARFNLEEDFNSESESIELHDSSKFSMFHIILSTVGAVTGKNVMAFEIHRPLETSSAEPVVFDATGVFGVNDCSIGVDSIINVSGSSFYMISNLNNYFDYTPVSYGYMINSVGTYVQWTVENLEGTKFNSFAIESIYTVTSWAFSLYGREKESTDENDSTAEEYLPLFADVNLETKYMGRTSWDVPIGIIGFRQFKHEYDTAASSSVYASAYILQYCKASGEGICPGIDEYPPVGEGQISPAECSEGYRGYAYRICSGGVLSSIHYDKCTYREPENLKYEVNRYVVVMDTTINIPAPSYKNIITKFYLLENTVLPDGIKFDEVTGAFSGKPTAEFELKPFTVYGENPAGATYTVISIGVRKGECKAEGNFPKITVGEIATYECSAAGSYVGTQKRACVLGARDGEWQKVQGTCIPIIILIIIIVMAIFIIAIVAFFVSRTTKKKKAVGGVKGKKTIKTNAPKKTTKSVKV